MAPLHGFSPAQWVEVRRGCTALFSGHAVEMRRLGWRTEDVFGVHPSAPAGAVQCYGLGLLVGDAKVIEMTADGARLQLRSGVCQTFTRRPNSWAVPIWTVGR